LSRKADGCDNAPMQSFFHTLKDRNRRMTCGVYLEEAVISWHNHRKICGD